MKNNQFKITFLQFFASWFSIVGASIPIVSGILK